MKSFARSDRVSSELQRVISDILRKDIHDPRLHMVTITGVKMSKDLRNARVYFSLAPGKYTHEDAAAAFQSASGFIKRTLSLQIELRYTPDIRFYYDESFDYGAHIDKLLASIVTTDGSSHNPTE